MSMTRILVTLAVLWLAGTTFSARAAATTPVVLGAEDDAAPWSYADGTGYVNDLVRQAFAEMGERVEFKVMPYARCKALTIRGELAGCFSASQVPELAHKLVYSQTPVFEARNLLVTLSRAPWSGCDSTRWPRPPRVGTVRAYEYTPQLEQALKGPTMIRHEADSEISNLRKLAAGRIDALVITVDDVKRLKLLQTLAQTHADIKTVCDYGVQPAYVAFSRAHPQGLSAQRSFDQGVARLRARKVFAHLQEEWRNRAIERASAKQH
ncbi:MAG TPA: transporter substrate-binding domain-containing protein [Aquabacterium sp.]|nr:transporter substrate-binding domain-containing protein [Aquabacterium sp.]